MAKLFLGDKEVTKLYLGSEFVVPAVSTEAPATPQPEPVKQVKYFCWTYRAGNGSFYTETATPAVGDVAGTILSNGQWWWSYKVAEWGTDDTGEFIRVAGAGILYRDPEGDVTEDMVE